MFEPALIKGFKEIRPILEDLAIDYWLDAGTLLWFYRSGHIKPRDKDIDLGAYYDQVYDTIYEIKQACADKDFELQVNDSKITFIKPGVRITVHLYQTMMVQKNFVFKAKGEDMGAIGYFKKLVFYDKHRKLADILNYVFLDGLSSFSNDLFFRERKKILLNKIKTVLLKIDDDIAQVLYQTIVAFGLRFKILKYYELIYPRMFFEFLIPKKFYGVLVNVPQQTDMYLEYCYGKEWKHPVEGFPKDGYYKIVSENSKRLI